MWLVYSMKMIWIGCCKKITQFDIVMIFDNPFIIRHFKLNTKKTTDKRSLPSFSDQTVQNSYALLRHIVTAPNPSRKENMLCQHR
jgi:hypothetical protein